MVPGSALIRAIGEAGQASEIQVQAAKYCKGERGMRDVPDASGRETDREMVRTLERD